MASLNRRLHTYGAKCRSYEVNCGDGKNKKNKKNVAIYSKDDGKNTQTECYIVPGLPSPQNVTTPSEATTTADDEQKFTRLAITIVGVFTLCWLPISIIYIVGNTSSDEIDRQAAVYLIAVFQLLAAFNSVLNPLVYMGTFRKTLAKTCFVRDRCEPSSNSSNGDATTTFGGKNDSTSQLDNNNLQQLLNYKNCVELVKVIGGGIEVEDGGEGKQQENNSMMGNKELNGNKIFPCKNDGENVFVVFY